MRERERFETLIKQLDTTQTQCCCLNAMPQNGHIMHIYIYIYIVVHITEKERPCYKCNAITCYGTVSINCWQHRNVNMKLFNLPHGFQHVSTVF